jgi:Cys-rich protein (TIGR01571 family)
MDAQQQQQQQQAPAPVQGAKPGPIDHKDIEDWTTRFNAVLADTSVISAPGPTDARPWSSAFFGCFDPIDLCCLTYFLPCVTFGKTHHRTRKNGNMEGYEPINTSVSSFHFVFMTLTLIYIQCLLLMGSACVGLHCIPMAMQSADIRKKYGLAGSCLEDIAKACCCALCTLTQNEKETIIREAEHQKGSSEQYSQGESMSYGQKA